MMRWATTLADYTVSVIACPVDYPGTFSSPGPQRTYRNPSDRRIVGLVTVAKSAAALQWRKLVGAEDHRRTNSQAGFTLVMARLSTARDGRWQHRGGYVSR